MEDDKKRCAIREASKILEEDPCLEAVALSQDQEKLSIATLGPDHDHRLVDRVSRAVSAARPDCGQLTRDGMCSVCGEKPATQVGSSRVVVKDVLGSTLVEKQNMLYRDFVLEMDRFEMAQACSQRAQAFRTRRRRAYPRISRVPTWPEKRLKQIASTFARLSQHPLLRAIRKLAHQGGVGPIHQIRKNLRAGAARPYPGAKLTLWEVATCLGRKTSRCVWLPSCQFHSRSA